MDKFEDYLKELNEILALLESGKLTLEESIAKYKRGIELSEYCIKVLNEAKELVVSKVE